MNERKFSRYNRVLSHNWWKVERAKFWFAVQYLRICNNFTLLRSSRQFIV